MHTCRSFRPRVSAPLPRLPAIALAAAAAAMPSAARAAEPIRLHPDNPHYFLFRGEPTILITSGEHYGAVLNGAFDFTAYLDELASHGLNQTRTFSGVYREVAGSFQIAGNTLAPEPEHYIAPWPRTERPGAADGGHKFDLARYDPAYFERLKDFLTQAGERGIVVELVLFCPFYDQRLWDVNPMNAANNVNGLAPIERDEVYTLGDEQLTALQLALVRKIVTEVNGFDNLYFEVCNEPYFVNVTDAFQRRVIETIVETEHGLPHRHLIAQNIANGSKRVEDPGPHISILNFHYATPPDAVALNYDLDRAIGDDETGFKGADDFTYRREGWEFILAGGAVYSNLDYSFTPDHPDGSAELTTSPGGGGEALRRQLAILKSFIHGFDFTAMTPNNSVIFGGVPADVTARALAEEGRQYAVYVHGGRRVGLLFHFPPGRYRAEWVNTKTGDVDKAETFEPRDGRHRLESPAYEQDIALRVLRVGE